MRSFGGEALSFTRFTEAVSAASASGVKLSKAKAALECVNRGCIYASLLCLYAVGGWLVNTGQVKVGSLIACIGRDATRGSSVTRASRARLASKERPPPASSSPERLNERAPRD